MPLQPGEKLGQYEILAGLETGEGSQLYKASDPQHERVVAIWVFPAGFSERFKSEAPAAAAVKHPHICEIYELGSQDGMDFLVLEYLEGQTLAQRLEGKPIALRDVMAMAVEIAEALDAAHGAGIVHRHLTPSNILLTKSGVKVLDFGSAEGAPAPPTESASQPQITPETPAPVVAPGKAGWTDADSATLQYSAPEQLEGKESGARADVFSLGTILYEAITGKKAFEGRSRAALIATIATAEPVSIIDLRPGAPPALQHVVERCLDKDPEDRFHTHDLLTQLRWIAEGGKTLVEKSPSLISSRTARIGLAAAAVLIAALAYPATMYVRGAADEGRFQLRVPVVGLNPANIAISPDGQIIAMVAKPDTSQAASLFVRRMGALAFQKLGGTDDSAQPFFSADSRFIGFVAGGRLKKVSVAGGAPQDLAEAASFSGGAWSAEGIILFGTPKGVFRVSAEGGKTTQVTTADAPETGHFWPSFLPDGKHFLYLAWSEQPANRAVFVGKLDSKDKTKIMAAETNAAYAAPGYVVFHREGSVFAQPFDAKTLALSGEAVHVADEVSSGGTGGRGDFDVSQNGSLLYYQGGGGPSGRANVQGNAQYGFVDWRGGLIAAAGETGPLGDFDLSPDGKLVAVTKQDPGSTGADIWVIDWERAGVSAQLTLDPADDIGPVWSQPDGRRVAFTTYRKGNADIYVKNADGTGAETPLLEGAGDEIVKDWSKDGRFIAYLSAHDNTQDIYALPMDGDKPSADKKPFPVVQGKYQKNEPQFSYDGKWLAYTSDESGGRFEVFITSFPSADQKLQISMAGGGQPRWKKDGKELYFRSLDNTVMVVTLKAGAKLEASSPAVLFRSQRNNAVLRDPNRHQLSVSPDGDHFLLMVPPGVAGRGGGSGVPQAQPAAAAQAAGPTGAAQQGSAGAASSGLTVIQRWTAAAGKAHK